ncbi:MAG: radical SAM protein [Gemmatimonadetes bacterium]|nr:radical SAM protein [Gemmatimonadota bacterium]
MVQHFTALGSRGTTTRYLSLDARGILNPPAATGMRFWSLNPYVGCEFGCAYCYARETHRWTIDRAANQRPALPTAREAATLPSAQAFERRILVKEDAAALLRRDLHPARLDGLPIVIGSATDPYQPAERRFKLTRALLEVFAEYRGLHLSIITKSALVARDATLLAELARRHRVSIHISLAALDAALLRQLEPRTPTPKARLGAMRRLADAGVPVGLLIAPILPGLTDDTVTLGTLLAAAREAGANWAGGGPLRLGPATRHTLFPWLLRHRPLLAHRYREHYGDRRGVTKPYADALNARLRTLMDRLGYDPREGMRREEELRTPSPGAGQLALFEG